MDSQEKKIIELQLNHLLENIQLRLNIIMRGSERQSKLDLDSLKDKIRDLYDQVLNLEMLQENVKQEKRPVEKPVAEKIREQKKDAKEKNAKEETKASGNEDPPEKEIKLVKSTTGPTEDVSPEKKEPDISPSKNADILKERQTTIADKFMDEDDRSLAAKIQKNPIRDLRLAIGVNDKFLFIKELFDGNLDAYNESIKNLNGITEKEKALQSLDELKKLYKWPEDSYYGAKLIELIERKFM